MNTIRTMKELSVRVLGESEWRLYRTVRLSALEESPDSFTASLADEREADEQFWQERMARSHRLLAERHHEPHGIVSLGPYIPDPSCGEIFGLYVFPKARGSGVAWALVDAAVGLAAEDHYRLVYYWVGVDNPRAVGFAKNFGFRLTGHRRPAHARDVNLGDQEIAMVFSLADDAMSVPNPTSDQPAPRDGPLS